MQPPQKMISIQELCKIFEVDISTLPDMSKQGPLKEMEERLKQFKEIFKKAFRKLAVKYHPDKGATPKQTMKFKHASSVYKELAKLKVVRRRKPIVIVRSGMYRTYTTTSSTTTSSTTTGGGWTTWTGE